MLETGGGSGEDRVQLFGGAGMTVVRWYNVSDVLGIEPLRQMVDGGHERVVLQLQAHGEAMGQVVQARIARDPTKSLAEWHDLCETKLELTYRMDEEMSVRGVTNIEGR